MLKLSNALDLIHKSDLLVYDIETTGLNTRKDIIIGFGLSNGTESIYVTHLAWDEDNLVEVTSKADCKVILEALLAHQTNLICHNASFDLRFTKNFFGLNLVSLLHTDTMLLKHTCDEDFPFGLKDIAANLFGDDAKDEQLKMKASIKANGGTVHQYFKADPKLLAEYCIKDCILTYKVYKHYRTDLDAQGLTKFFYEDEVMPLYKHVIIPMELAGIPIDIPLLQLTKSELDQDLADLEMLIQTMLKPHTNIFSSWFLNKEYEVTRSGSFAQGVAAVLNVNLPKLESGKYSMTQDNIAELPKNLLFCKFMSGEQALSSDLIHKVRLHMNNGEPVVNLSSKHHLKKIFFDTLKEEPLSRTPTGMPQVDDTFLQSIKHKYEFVPLLLDYNKLVKLKGTYIDRLLEEQENGIWYPSFQQHRTVSGRLGSDAQQLPRKLDEGTASDIVRKYNNRVRDFLISSPDSVLIGADYESLEPKVFSHMSGDEKLKDIFRKGHDFYSTIAIDTEGLKGVSADKQAPNYLGKVNKKARQNAKPYALGIPYGLTGYKLQFELDIDQKSADKLVENYLKAYPQLALFMESSKLEAKTKGYVKSEAGRVRHLRRAKVLYDKHGDELLDSLHLWKQFHEQVGLYRHMKELRKEYSNLLNNSINFKIQSLAASIVNRACIAMSKKFGMLGLKATIVLQVHDECVVHCPLDESKEVCDIMRETMEDTYKLSIPMIAEPNIATRYGDTK